MLVQVPFRFGVLSRWAHRLRILDSVRASTGVADPCAHEGGQIDGDPIERGGGGVAGAGDEGPADDGPTERGGVAQLLVFVGGGGGGGGARGGEEGPADDEPAERGGVAQLLVFVGGGGGGGGARGGGEGQPDEGPAAGGDCSGLCWEISAGVLLVEVHLSSSCVVRVLDAALRVMLHFEQLVAQPTLPGCASSSRSSSASSLFNIAAPNAQQKQQSKTTESSSLSLENHFPVTKDASCRTNSTTIAATQGSFVHSCHSFNRVNLCTTGVPCTTGMSSKTHVITARERGDRAPRRCNTRRTGHAKTASARRVAPTVSFGAHHRSIAHT